LSTLVLIFCFFYVPETGKLTLEEVDDIFLSNKRAWETSYSKNKMIVRARFEI
jgi:SP family sugar:H+ symporter-like MFS transporter